MAFFVFLLFSLLGLSSSSSILDLDLAKFTTQEQVSTLFQLWKKEHGRVYQNQEEDAERFEVFHKNLNYIRHVNANRKSTHSHRLGLNKFADITPEELSKMYLQDPKDVSQHVNMANKKMKKDKFSCDDAPASWDWRNKGVITEVKNQAHCGSGWAFSATGAIEATNAIVTGNLVSVSEQEIIDCVSKASGCEGGYHFHAFEWVIENGGIATEVDYPYRAENGTCKSNKAQNAVTIDSFDGYLITNYSSAAEADEALLCATFEQPISAAMDGRDFFFYTDGIYEGGNCSSPYGINHFVLIVGYDSVDGVDYWIVKNSWGKDWGMDGYIWIQRNTGNEAGVCAINFFVAFPIKEKPAIRVKPDKKRLDYSPL
ncbi:Cysteine peptidase [Vigna unguiculata]|uniref:Cysteine peptidase n=2 Tax=Vigna unguiculata TaxID=3917 RepID=A0A4D6L7H4_VIGUN|nr:Cysteine peptidase [Vigna unguiculata]